MLNIETIQITPEILAPIVEVEEFKFETATPFETLHRMAELIT